MSVPFGDNIKYLGAKPLDNRQKYNTVSEMSGMVDNTLCDGLIAYCVETDKTYQWKSANTVDATLGRWREFATGSVSDVIKYVDQLPTDDIKNIIYGVKEATGQTTTISLVSPVPGVAKPSKQDAINYFSQYFTVTDLGDAEDKLQLNIYPDLVIHRSEWTEDYSASRGDFNEMFYSVSSGDMEFYKNSDWVMSTTAFVEDYPLMMDSASFPTWVYYNGNEEEQSLTKIGSGSAEISDKYKKIFNGTQEAWNALTTEEKKEYDNVSIPDPTSAEALVDAVENGNMDAVTSNAVYNAIAYRQTSAVVCVFRRMRTDGSGVEETGSTRQCLVLPLLGAEKLALIIGDGEVNINTTESLQKFSFALSGIAPNGIVNDGCLNIAITGQPTPNLGYCGGFGDFWINDVPAGLSNTKCKARFMCVCKLQ